MTPNDLTLEQALASAYLDGDVTAAERAQVEASAELQAMVAALRGTSTLIATVAAPSEATREAGIAAALAAFDGLSAHNVVSLDSRRRWPSRVLTAAAAVLLVGVVGASVLRNDSSDTKASVAPDGKRSETGVAEDAAGSAEPASADNEVVLATSAALLEISDPQDLLSLSVPTAPPADTSPVADTTAGGAGESTPAPARLDSYNVDALACLSETQLFLADISYRGMVAIAVRDTVTGVTEAIDGNCTVLARVNP